MASTPRIDKIERAIRSNEVDNDFIAAPHTTIKNEQGDARQIPNLSNNLKASMGVERVVFNSIKKLDKEFGTGGESVFELSKKDARIRFVGEWITSVASSHSAHIQASDSGTDYIEVTFYGTGLNLLQMFNANSRDIRASIDGGAEGANIYGNYSSITSGRNYRTNQALPIVDGLSLGVHTVKIRSAQPLAGAYIYAYGVEVLNESTQLTVNAGQPSYGKLETKLDAQTLLDYKPTDLTGVKGGRVVTYLDEEGNLGQASQVVDPAVTVGDPTELVTNGTFDTDLTGWTLALGSPAGSIVVNGSNQASMTLGGSFGTNARMHQTLTTVIGQKYTVNFDLINISGPAGGTGVVWVYESGALSTIVTSKSYELSEPVGAKSISFTATTTTSTITFSPSVQYNTNMTIDNISIKETAYDFLALGDTDHSSEEIYRRINWREFGANRADDFSTLAGVTSARAFTLDDGTTTLVGDNVVALGTGDVLNMSGAGSYTLTFVGTGLDIVTTNIPQNVNSGEIIIDGVSVGEVDTTGLQTGAENFQTVKICSGLPYGTHTVKMVKNTEPLRAKDFIVYQPKKPALPDNTFEISDYNVMADYGVIVSSDNDVNEQTATGVIRKTSNREAVYVGPNWTSNGVADLNKLDGYDIATPTNGEYVERYFWGTGFEYRTWGQSGDSGDIQVTLDGSVDLSSFTTSTFGSDVGITPATGVLDFIVSSNGLRGLSVSGLTLGWHKVVFTKINGSRMHGGVLDIITPIHVNNTKVGSLSLSDSREDQKFEDAAKNIDMSRAKAWFVYDSGANEVLSSYNISAVLEVGTNELLNFYFKRPFKDNPVAMPSSSGESNPYIRVSNLLGSQSEPVDKHGGRIQNANVVSASIIMCVFFGELENEDEIDLTEL